MQLRTPWRPPQLEHSHRRILRNMTDETVTPVCIVPPFMSEAFTFSVRVKIRKTRLRTFAALVKNQMTRFGTFSGLNQNPQPTFRNLSALVKKSKNKVQDFCQTCQNPKTKVGTLSRLNPILFQCFEHSKKKKKRFWSDFPYQSKHNGKVPFPLLHQRVVQWVKVPGVQARRFLRSSLSASSMNTF